ncbi:MAG: hypothetical protein JWL80_25, partial [Parcubacteria group bacterium]|nr:hypothetical protein [Parcubacteria group bacterium]
MHHVKKLKGAYLKTFLFSVFVIVFFVSQTNVALALYQQLQQINPMAVTIDAYTLDNGSTANNTVSISGTVRGAEYQYEFDCQDPSGAYMGSGYGHIENGATYVGGLTTQSLNTVISGTGVTGGNCNGGFSPEDDDEVRYLYTFSGTLDVSGYPNGPASVTVTYSTPGVHGSGNNEPAYTVSDTFNFTVSHGATVTVNRNSCPLGTTWTASTGHTGTNTGSFTFAPAQGGTLVTISAVPPSGSFTGTIPASQVVFAGDNDSFDLQCSGGAPPTNVTLSADTNSLSCSQTATLTWSSQGATSCSAPWTSSTNTSGSQGGIGAGTYNIT